MLILNQKFKDYDHFENNYAIKKSENCQESINKELYLWKFLKVYY